VSYLELPKTLVETLNSYIYEQTVTESALRYLQLDLEGIIRRILPRSKADEAHLANACYVAEELCTGLALGAPADTILSLSYALNSVLEQLQQAARTVTYVTIPELDNLLVTVEAVYQGHLPSKALFSAIRDARRARVRLFRRYRLLSVAGALKSPLRGEVQRALKSLHQGLNLLKTDLVAGAGQVRSAAEQLEPLERGPRSVPVEGLPLDIGFILAKIATLPPSQRLTEEYSKNWHETLLETWEGLREEILLDSEKADELLAEVEDRLDWMHDSLELDAAELKEAVTDFLEAWKTLMDGRLILKDVWGTGLERLALALIGVIKGTVPDLVLAEVASSYRSVAWNADIRRFIGHYLRLGDQRIAMTALEAVLEVAPNLRLPDTYLLGRQCVHCHQEYGESVDCAHRVCHSFFETSA
jgi:hypothetical protein